MRFIFARLILCRRLAITACLLLAASLHMTPLAAMPQGDVQKLIEGRATNGYTAKLQGTRYTMFNAQGVKCPSCGSLLNGTFKVRIRISAGGVIEKEMKFTNGDTEPVRIDSAAISGAEVVFPEVGL